MEGARPIEPVLLPATKFHPPARREDALLRGRLVEALKGRLPKARLTLFSAPAGAGKTTLLAELPRVFPEMKWAWLLLDPEDNDPSRFAAALAASLTLANLPAGTAATDAVAAIVNQAARRAGDAIALAMDDFHVIDEPAVHQAVERLVERLPANMRVVIASRCDPPVGVSKWRARGELAELRFGELAFTEEETTELASSCLHLSLSPEELRELHARAEGWAAGLRLLAASMAQHSPGNGAALRHGTQGRQRVFEFLAEEVLDRQPAALRRFLLDTSVLAALRKDVCDALTGRADSDRVLHDLYHRNLYVVAVDESGLQYRYHDLFADFLRDRLRRERPGDWVKLHEKAARIEPDPGRRIQHWIAAENWAGAAAEIQRAGPDYMRRGFAFTIRGWILALPERVRRERPRLSYLLGSAIWARNDFHTARPYFEEALDGFRRTGDEAAQGETLAALSITAMNANEPERARALFEEALQFPLPPASGVQFHAAAGWHAVSRRDWPLVTRSLDRLLELMATSAAPFDAFAMHLVFIGTSLPEFTDRLDRAIGRLEGHVQSSADLNRSCYHMLRAACRLFRGDTAGAREASTRALAMADRSELPLTVRLYGIVVRALTAYAESDWRGVEAIGDELTEADADALLIRNWQSIVAYFVGRARWLAGDTGGLDECCRRIPAVDPAESPHTHTHKLLLAGMQHLSARCYARAEQVFRQACEMEQEHRLTAGHSSASVLLAYTHLSRGHLEAAIETFAPHVELLDRLNGPGNLLRENPIVVPLLRLLHEKKRHRAFVERVLGMLGVEVEVAGAAGRAPLSGREIEVLRVMAEGLSNREIGERLFVSEATVKTHVQRVLRKLDATSRTQAVARAREWMLL